MDIYQLRLVRLVTPFIAILLMLFLASCGEKPIGTVTELSDDPADETAAIFRFEAGKQVIFCGKLHSRRFTKICAGDYPSVSPSGKFVAYNPISDKAHHNPAIQPIEVIEMATGKVTSFNSIPRDITPWPDSAWSTDEKLITFHVHDFQGNRGRCVVSTEDGSYWRGTDAEFDSRYQGIFRSPELQARRSVEGRLSIENFKHVGALFFHPGSGKTIRLTPENMGARSTPIWIERTREVLFVGVRVSPPYREEDVTDGSVYLIKPEAKDWANAPKNEWDEAIIAPGEQVSSSK